MNGDQDKDLCEDWMRGVARPEHSSCRSHGERVLRTGGYYAIIHFWPISGGFGKRMGMLAVALEAIGRVERIRRLSDLCRWLRRRELRSGEGSAIIYTSLLAPLAVLLRVFRPRCRVYYIVRGDEVSFTSFAGRRFRALVAVCFQKLMAATGCRFIFASADLRGLFLRRLGKIRHARLLPNTLGRLLPASRPFDGVIGIVGDFGTVKDIELAIQNLGHGLFAVELYGNRSMPEQWRRPWLTSHGVVSKLSEHLRSVSLVILASRSEGFPNVLLDALEAGCAVVVRRGFPFARLPISDSWRFDLQDDCAGPCDFSDLERVLMRLFQEQCDFRKDNPILFQLAESDWRDRVWRAFA
jgi:hypothetical protein